MQLNTMDMDTATLLDAPSATGVRTAYQPIVDIETGAVVAYEALARWPTGQGATPDAMFDAARAEGRLAELDWECRLAAVQGALAHELGRDLVLFVNVEPETLGEPAPAGSAATIAAADRELRVMLELTERSLTRDPAMLLRAVEWARRHGWGIALDDVGTDPDSLALLPFVAPDVIKLDMTLIRNHPTAAQAAIMAAVMAHSERTEAIILAEGIETERDLGQAIALGATLGQGWYYGRPGPLRSIPTPPTPLVLRSMPTPSHPLTDATPFDLVAGSPRVRVGRKDLLLELSHHVETRGMHIDPAAVVVSAFQTSARFTPPTERRYRALAERCPLVCAIGLDLHPGRDPLLHTASIDPTDPLVREWTVTVVSSHYAAALIARDLGDDGPDASRRFEFVVTHDRDLVVAAARMLMSRTTLRDVV
ncbi:MAG: hypothetical protein JWM34_3343 [Ilumatobacteraceae bacterium]|nr:hypothetical protein [Ilumatobacteraceae bacterium]